MTLQEMKSRKREAGYTNEMISDLTGIPLSTVQKIFAGITKAPRLQTKIALENLLAAADTAKHSVISDTANHLDIADTANNAGPSFPGTYQVREDSAAFKAGPGHKQRISYPFQGSYTEDDYMALPDDQRVELIDGVFYDLASPLNIHQAILRELSFQFYLCLESHPECEFFMAPADVRLDRDRKTVVQPDLFVYCNHKEEDKRLHCGPPDFILEILSPSNPAHDLFRKLSKYRFSGVREYWIVDPQHQKVIVYDLEHDLPPALYPFSGRIPVILSNGECEIDFDRIYQKISKYL